MNTRNSLAPLYVLAAALIIGVIVLWLVGKEILAPLVAQLGQMGQVLGQ